MQLTMLIAYRNEIRLRWLTRL